MSGNRSLVYSPEFQEYIRNTEREHGLPPGLVSKVIKVESSGRPDAVSPKGARGLMQLMPETARSVGVQNPDDPYENVKGGAAYLSQLIKQYNGDTKAALAHYNGGTRQGQLVAAGKEPTFKETRDYVVKVDSAGSQVAPARGPRPANPAPEKPMGQYDKTAVEKGVVKALQAGVKPEDIVARLAEREDTAERTKRALAAGATPEQVIEAAGGSALAAYRAQQKEVSEMSAPAKIAAGAGARIGDLWLGGKQLLGKATTEEVEEKRARDAALMESGWAKAGSFLPDVAAGLAVPGFGTAGTLARIGGRALASGAVDAGLGALEARGAGESRGQAALVGGLTGAAGGAASVPIEALGKKAVSGVMKGAGAITGKVADTPQGEFFQRAQELGIKLTPAQLGSPSGEFAERAGRYIPFVSGRQAANLEAQQTMLRGAMEKAAAEVPTKPGQTAQEVVVDSLTRARNAAKKTAGAKFDEVARIAAENPTTPVVPDALRRAALEQQGQLQDVFEKFGHRQLKSRLDDVVKGTSPQASVILEASGKPFTKPAQMTFDEARAFREELGDVIRQLERQAGTGGVSEKQLGAMKQVFKGLEKDLDTWGKSNPAVKSAWDDARKTYRKDYVEVFKEPANVRRALKPDFDVDRLIAANFGPTSGVKSRNLFKALDPEGQEAVRNMLIQRAADLAEKDPVKAGKEFAKLAGKEYDHVFSESQRELFDNLKDLASTLHKGEGPFRTRLDVGRLARAYTAPMTGGLGVGALIGGATGLSPMVGGMAGAGATSLLLNSPLARRTMLAPGVETLSPALRKMLIQNPARAAALMGAHGTDTGVILSDLLREQMNKE